MNDGLAAFGAMDMVVVDKCPEGNCDSSTTFFVPTEVMQMPLSVEHSRRARWTRPFGQV